MIAWDKHKIETKPDNVGVMKLKSGKDLEQNLVNAKLIVISGNPPEKRANSSFKAIFCLLCFFFLVSEVS